MKLAILAILLTVLFLGFFSYLLIRFPRDKTIPKHTQIRRIILFWVCFFVVMVCMFVSTLFFGTVNPFVGVSSFFSVKVLGSQYAQTDSRQNDVFPSLEKTYIIASDYNQAVLERAVAAAYAGTPFAAQTHTVIWQPSDSNVALFFIDDERGQCGSGVIIKYSAHAVLELNLNLY